MAGMKTALIVGVLFGLAGSWAMADQPPAPKAAAFELSEVRLLDGPFKSAQDLDATYLLSLDPERLLHNFRVNAGLPSTAKPLGGWESPTIELRGHFVGHYLSACSMMYQSTGRQEFKDRVDYLVTELGKCQDKLGTGYLSAFPASEFDRLEAGQHVWAPYYTVHKILAGLLDAYRFCGNQKALEMATRMADYFDGRIAKLSPEQIERMLHTVGRGPGTEFGGMSEALHDLYGFTGNPEHLKLASTFDRAWFLDPLADGQDKLAGLHANCHIPQVEGFARHYELTGDEGCRDAADFFWDIVTGRHSFVTGSNSFAEHFAKPGVEASQLSPTTGETCNTYNMLKLTRHLFEWDPQAKYADYYERALYNHILGSIDPDTGTTIYFLSLLPGHFKVYGTPTESFWCCNGTGVENHAKYGDSIYFHSPDGQTLWVNLYIASELQWKEKGLTLRQETQFPVESTSTLLVSTTHPQRLAVKLRVPVWATAGVSVKVNGQPQDATAAPESYLTLDRQWIDGDKIELSLPMKLTLYRAMDLKDNVALLYGPIVLAGELGHDHMPLSDHATDQNKYNKIRPGTVPALVTDDANPEDWLKPVPGKPLTFTTDHVGEPNDATLIPLYDIHHECYTVYWKLKSPAQAPATQPAASGY